MVAKPPRCGLNHKRIYRIVSALLQCLTDIYRDCHISNNLAVLDFSLASPPTYYYKESQVTTFSHLRQNSSTFPESVLTS